MKLKSASLEKKIGLLKVKEQEFGQQFDKNNRRWEKIWHSLQSSIKAQNFKLFISEKGYIWSTN